jgi:hypothetical protein
VLLDPCFHLSNQILRDIDGLGLAGDLEGQVMADMFLPGLAVTALAPTMPGDLDKAGGDEGTSGLELPDPALNHLLQMGGRTSWFHGSTSPFQGRVYPDIGRVYLLISYWQE